MSLLLIFIGHPQLDTNFYLKFEANVILKFKDKRLLPYRAVTYEILHITI